MNAIRFVMFGLTYGAAMLAAELVLAALGLALALVGLLLAHLYPWAPTTRTQFWLALAVVCLALAQVLHWLLR